MSAPKYNFSLIPNDSEGWALINNMKHFLNPNQRMRVRGQHMTDEAKAEGGSRKYRYSLPLSKAKFLRVYIEEKK